MEKRQGPQAAGRRWQGERRLDLQIVPMGPKVADRPRHTSNKERFGYPDNTNEKAHGAIIEGGEYNPGFGSHRFRHLDHLPTGRWSISDTF